MLTSVTQVACIPVNRQRTVSPVAALMGTALTGKYCRVPRRTLGYSQTVLHGTTGYGLSRPGGRADRCGTGHHAPRLQHQQRPPVPLHAVAGCPRHQLCGGRASSLRHELAALRRGLGRCQRQVRHAVPERSPLREPRASASARARAIAWCGPGGSVTPGVLCGAVLQAPTPSAAARAAASLRSIRRRANPQLKVLPSCPSQTT